jgi:hypothetical protein
MGADTAGPYVLGPDYLLPILRFRLPRQSWRSFARVTLRSLRLPAPSVCLRGVGPNAAGLGLTWLWRSGRGTSGIRRIGTPS